MKIALLPTFKQTRTLPTRIEFFVARAVITGLCVHGFHSILLGDKIIILWSQRGAFSFGELLKVKPSRYIAKNFIKPYRNN
jgi:hypothetical protein